VAARIDREAFEAWRAHPITEQLLRMMEVEAARLREQWTALSFDGGSSDPYMLARMRERALLLRELRQIEAENIEEVLNGRE
jgi:hypothetical protein